MTDGQRDAASVAAARERLAEAAGSLTEAAATLRAAIDSGTVPPGATAALAARLEDLADRMRPELPHSAPERSRAPGESE
ncbi:hypothetical protein [Amycolatopsis sp. NPDC057786]|uniref:hypothetical protein n=1 Tax=Amycolatopsis sp. NPDC057786 TaxID=3346250 RepID=UPI00366BD145